MSDAAVEPPALEELLGLLQRPGASDLHLKVGSPPHVRVDGRLEPVEGPALAPAALAALARQLLPERRVAEFEAAGEADFAHSVPGVGRFRVNVHRQRGSFGLVVRRVPPGMPTFESLGLPETVRRFATERSGLVIVSGLAASGRSTTIAALLDAVNETRAASIVTIEDPIEVLHTDKRSIVSQREVGSDTPSYAEAAARVLRHDPDVVYVGEVRDAQTAQAVLDAAGTGRLVFTTMRANGASEAVDRIVEFFPPFGQRQARQTLASCLRGIVSQRLVERRDGRGRVPAVEILTMTSHVFEAIAEPDRAVSTLDRLMAEGEYYGMQTLDQSLFRLAQDGTVTGRAALAAAANPEDLRIALETGGVPLD